MSLLRAQFVQNTARNCGKRALVTAANRGLGRAVAESLLAEHCRVCVTSSSELSIEAAAREMANAGGEVHALAADLGRDDEYDRLFAWGTSTLGGLDILVNNTVGPPKGRGTRTRCCGRSGR
jgi:3-oxoacyl-[acyl-carrier protein] reductase